MHPDQVLFQGERTLPQMPAIDHYAGSEKLISKALAIQGEKGAVFDITCDCEDGARAGEEESHAHMVVDMVRSDANQFGRVGARIHDITHRSWQRDAEILIKGAGTRLAFLTLPKPRSAKDVAIQIAFIRDQQRYNGQHRKLPVHVLIETHGALREAWDIAALDGVESLDFGLMDFVSAHHGAIPGDAMRSPAQFEHPLIARAKTDIAAAALAHGVIPSHNVTTELNDLAIIRNDALRARREFGYLRMWSIHPKQIDPILSAMQPDFSEVEEADAILNAAADKDWGPIQHAGKLHDRASYRYYWTLLKRAQATGVSIPARSQARFFDTP